LASVKKINANGIKYILEMLHQSMDEVNRNEFLNQVEVKLESLSSKDVSEIKTI
jgi:hypothetical protein